MSDPVPSQPKICAVVVTFNRLPLLQECIDSLQSQTRKLDDILVINNGSTDGTADWLATRAGIRAVTQENSGGAGGFFSGMRHAYEGGYDWIWIMDDDTIPSLDALEHFVASKAFPLPETGYLCSLAQWKDGSLHCMNLPEVAESGEWMNAVVADRLIPVTRCSFVSVIVRREVIKQCGLPLRQMFIWFDDYEYTRRVSEKFRGYLVLDSVALHKTATNYATSINDFSDALVNKFRYGLRNAVFVRLTDNARSLPYRVVRALIFSAGILRDAARKLTPKNTWVLAKALASGFWFSPQVEYPE